MAPRIAILFNCQHESLAVALRALLPDADILNFDLNALSEKNWAEVASTLASCDHVISQDVAPGYGPLSTRALRAAARNYHLMPAFRFGGFHPDCVTVWLDRTPMRAAAGGLHSRIVVAGLLAGMAAEEIIDLFNMLVFARLGYLDALADQSVLLIEKFAAYAIDLSALVPKWCTSGCFMTSPTRPKMVVFLDLARIVCEMMGLAPQAAPPAASLNDPMAALSTVPFLPEIAGRHAMLPEGAYRDALPAGPLSLGEYVRNSTSLLARAPLSCLRAVQGVPEAMERLALTTTPRAHRVIMQTPGSQCLLSWHGTIVRIEAASSLLVQEKLWPPSVESSDFILAPIPGEDGNARADILGGLDIAQAPISGAVSLRRQGRAMVAESGRLAVPFRAEGTGADASFLLLSVSAVAGLRDILSRDWAWQGTPRRAAAARIRLRPGFILDFGIFAFNLLEAPPEPVPASEEGGAGYRFETPSGTITIRPVQDASRGREIALMADPQRRMPDESGSIPEFRTARQASWPLATGEEILHPPVTAGRRDATWVFERCTWPGGLPSGLSQHQAILRRMPGRAVLLFPGLEGMLFDARGTLADTPATALPRGASLPPGLRIEDDALLIEAECLASAPAIDEPVAVCLSPAWQDYDGWLIDVALRLHVMAPFLPRGARLLVPPGFAEAAPAHMALLEALGLGQWPALEAPALLCRLADVVWLDNTQLATTPAALLRAFRARIAALFPAPAETTSRIFIKRAGGRGIAPNDAFEGFLATQNFTTVVLEDLSPAAQIALFRGAGMVIGAHGAGLANIVFCPDGARVLEISPRGQFRPRYWMLAEKCGLIHGVLPCATDGGGFDSAIQLDIGRMRALLRALRLTFDK